MSRHQFCPLLVAFVAFLFFAPVFFFLQITHDAAWQMWIGRQLLHGADLYSDLIEVNPPLWFWIAEPLSAVCQIVGLGDLQIVVAFFLACIAISLVLTSKVLSGLPHWHRTLLLVALVIAALPPGNFGQREHFTFIATVPYVLLIGRRSTDANISPRLAIAIGCFAAVGFALKPQFAFVPLALELWLRRSIVRPETVALAIGAATYAFSVFLFEPDYFTKALPLVQQAYGQFAPVHPTALLRITLPFVVALLVRPGREESSRALLIAALTFYLIHVSQLKGFAYQAIPALGMLILALAASVRAEISVRNALAFGAAVFALTPNLAPYHTDAWADVPSGSSYAGLSVAPRAGWPLVEERELKWPLRSMSLWMAPALGPAIRPWVEHDLACNPPAYLLVDDTNLDFSSMFRDILSHYEFVETHGRVRLMRLVGRPLRPATCRTIY
jgi:hypothetical protein